MVRPLKPEYRLALPAPAPKRRGGACVGLKLRRPALDDAEALGALFLDAYDGTIDHEGEDLAASVAEVRGFFDGRTGRPITECSVVAWEGSTPVGASMVGWLERRGCPFVAYVVTASAAKRQGVGRLVLGESVRRVARAGHKEIRAFITEGNTASEALFASMGFERL